MILSILSRRRPVCSRKWLKERKETVEWLNRGVRVVNVRICVPHQSSTRLDLSGTGFKGTVYWDTYVNEILVVMVH
jgi:hypothetical protein